MDEKILTAKLPKELFMGGTIGDCSCDGDGCNSDEGGCDASDASCGQDC